MSGVPMIPLEDLMAAKQVSVDPAKFADERFELYSIPAFDGRKPELLTGGEIGSTKQLVRPRDVLLSKIVPHIRRAWIVGAAGECRQIASGEWIVFRSEKVVPEYLRHALLCDSFHAQFMQTVSGVGGSLLRARPAQVAKIEIRLPSIAEQRRIAAVLDKAEALSTKRREALAHLERLAGSIFVEMFGDPIANPKAWPTRSLSEVGKVTTGGTPPSAKEGMFGGEIPFITPGDLESDKAPKRWVTEAGAREAGTVRAGAALVCCIGATIGKIGAAVVRSSFNQQLNAVEWTTGLVDDLFGLAALKFLKPTIVTSGASTTLPILKKSSFERLVIPVPPLGLQIEFARRVQGVAHLKARLRESLSQSGALFASMQQSALKGEL